MSKTFPLAVLIYVNDLERFLSQSGNVNKVNCPYNDVNESPLKLVVTRYADDTVLYFLQTQMKMFKMH